MNPSRPTGILGLFLCFCAGAGIADTEVYKWVDEKGVVNYGSAPPQQGGAKKLAPDSSRVSVVPGTSQKRQESDGATAMQERIGRLERDLENERRSRSVAAQAADTSEAARIARLREQCEQERRVDCDGADPLATRYDTIIVVPGVRPVRPHKPGLNNPTKPPPSTTPPAFTSPRTPPVRTQTAGGTAKNTDR